MGRTNRVLIALAAALCGWWVMLIACRVEFPASVFLPLNPAPAASVVQPVAESVVTAVAVAEPVAVELILAPMVEPVVPAAPRVRYVGEAMPLPQGKEMTMAFCVVDHYFEYVEIYRALIGRDSPSEKEHSTMVPNVRIWKAGVTNIKSFSGMSPDFVYFLDVHVPNLAAAEALANTPEYLAANAVYILRCENKSPTKVLEMIGSLRPVRTRAEAAISRVS